MYIYIPHPFSSQEMGSSAGASPAAAEAKEAGNRSFAAGDDAAALEAYSRAISLAPHDETLYSNRSAANARMVRSRPIQCFLVDYECGLYKILFYLFLCVQESVIPLLPPPVCITHTTAILLRDLCAIHDFPPTLPGYAIHHTILVMTISCIG